MCHCHYTSSATHYYLRNFLNNKNGLRVIPTKILCIFHSMFYINIFVLLILSKESRESWISPFQHEQFYVMNIFVASYVTSKHYPGGDTSKHVSR